MYEDHSLTRVPFAIVAKYNLQICLSLNLEMGDLVPVDDNYAMRVRLPDGTLYLHNARYITSLEGTDDTLHELVVTENLEIFYRNNQQTPFGFAGRLSDMHTPIVLDFFSSSPAIAKYYELRDILMSGNMPNGSS